MKSDTELLNSITSFYRSRLLPFMRNHKLKLGVIASLVLFTLSLFGDLWQFPFDASIWGNASDFLMLVVSCFTAYYLVMTFREQQEITRIEQRNFRLRFLPKIVITFSGSQITFRVEENAIIKFDFYSSDRGVFKLLDDWMLHGERHMDLPVGHTHFIHTYQNDRRASNVETLIFTFTDVQNNLYQQRVYITASTYDVSIQSPRFIENLKPNADFQSAIQNIRTGV